MIEKKYLLLSLAATLIFLYGCGGTRNNTSSMTQSAGGMGSAAVYDSAPMENSIAMDTGMAESMIEPESAQWSFDTTAEKKVIDERSDKIIKTGNINIESDRFDSVVEDIKASAKNSGGYVESGNTWVSDDRNGIVRRYDAVLRIPVDEFERVKLYIEGLGKLVSSSENAEDATAAYYDINSRLRTREIEEERVLDMIERATKIEDLIELEQRLSYIRTDIELYKNRMNSIDRSEAEGSKELREVDQPDGADITGSGCIFSRRDNPVNYSRTIDGSRCRHNTKEGYHIRLFFPGNLLSLLTFFILISSNISGLKLFNEDIGTVRAMVKPSPVIASVTGKCRLLSEPFESSALVKPLNQFDKVEIIMDVSMEWYYVEDMHDDVRGWCRRESLDIPDEPETNISRMNKRQLERYINSIGLTSNTEYLLWTDIDRQLTHIFQGKENKWRLERTFICSTGKNVSPTIRGIFKAQERGDWFYSERLKSGAMYWVRFEGAYLYHSLAMDRHKNITDNVLGIRRSNGCIRLSVENAAWLYRNIPTDSTVYVN